jgi:PHS family inorganic phosphate transporter-like MFS transporter
MTIPETPRFTFDVARDIEKADADIKAYIDGQPTGHPDGVQREQTKVISKPTFAQPRASWSDFCTYFTKWRNGSVLFATMASWFFVDFAFYGLGLNNSAILEVIGYSSGSDVYQVLYNTAVGNLILVCAGSLPGYWLSVLTIDYFGRKPIQIGGFIILTIIFCIIGFAYDSLSRHALLVLYVLAQFFLNFGPNTTTFIIPGECFPTRYRSTCHGLSAASGKLGATITQVIAYPLLVKSRGAPATCKGSACSPWLDHLMEIFACFMLCGTLISFLVPETKRQTLEVLAGEPPVPRSDGNSSGRGRRGGLLFAFSLWLHSLGKKGGESSQAQSNGHHGSERADDDYVTAANRDYSMSIPSTGKILCSPRPNEDEGYEQHRVGTIPLQDVGIQLSVLK